jgi:hypothetical protein
MPIHPWQSSFTTGEISDQLDARTDWAKYQAGAKCLQNFVVKPHGGIARRAGLVFLGEVKNSANPVRLVKFEFNIEQAYVLEFGPLYIRVWANRGRVLASEGGPQVEVVSPYTAAQLMQLRFEQSADVLYITHVAHKPMMFKRTAANAFALEILTFTPPPAVPLDPSVPDPNSGLVTINRQPAS